MGVVEEVGENWGEKITINSKNLPPDPPTIRLSLYDSTPNNNDKI